MSGGVKLKKLLSFPTPGLTGSGSKGVSQLAIGQHNQDTAYSPLWQMVKVSWRDPAQASLLRSEEEVLAAAEQGLLSLEPTAVVLNCTVVHRGIKGALPGAQISRARN